LADARFTAAKKSPIPSIRIVSNQGVLFCEGQSVGNLHARS
jgi:hypothetical protein